MKKIHLGKEYLLTTDSRDIVLPCSLRETVWNWSQQQNIELEGHMYGVNNLDVWRIRNNEQRVRFLLRWL
jgi:hypothetical protein